MVEVPELLAGDVVTRPAPAGTAGRVGGCRVVQEKRLDGVGRGSEAAGNRRGRCSGGADECVDLAQVDAGEVGPYAGASGYQTVFTCPHKPGGSDGGRPVSSTDTPKITLCG